MPFDPHDHPDPDQMLNCMRCGLCLPSCPTFQITGRERSSPRGRIALMLAVSQGRLELDAPIFAQEMDYCLGCLACTTACPAGVDYGSLLESARDQVERIQPRWKRRLKNLAFALFEQPWRLKVVAGLMRLYQVSGLRGLAFLLPKKLRQLESLMPPVNRRLSSSQIPAVTRPVGPEKHKVGMLTGCVMDFLFAPENLATVDVLRRNGCTVLTPKNQVCCGALHAHAGRLDGARELAKRNIVVFEELGVDFIVVNSAGCGAAMKHYGRLLAEEPAWAARAEEFSKRVRDVHEMPYRVPAQGPGGSLTYHDACHLAHGQGVRTQPRALMQSLPESTYVELPRADHCCGSAGVYNLTHFDTSMELLEQKLDHIESTGASVVGVANPGCLLQIRYGLAKRGSKCRAEHPITLLAEGYAREDERNNH